MLREPLNLPDPALQPTCPARNGPRWSLHPSPKDLAAVSLQLAGLAGSKVVSETHWHTPHTQWQAGQAAEHTHRTAWAAQPMHATQTQRRAHCPVLFLLSRKTECRFSSEKMCALILHNQKHTQTCTAHLNVSMASKPVKYPCSGALAVVYKSPSACQIGQCDVWVFQMWKVTS